MFAVMMALVCGFASCGGDDNDNSSETGIGEISEIEPVREELIPFLGKWEIDANDYYHEVTYPDYSIFFYQEGKCCVTQINNDTKNQFLSWDYDATNKYLSIAGLAKAQWQITSIGDDAWTGLALWTGGNNGYSAKKDTSIVSLLQYLLNAVGSWKCDTISATISNTVRDHFNVSRVHSYEPHDGVIRPYSYTFIHVWYGDRYGNKTEVKADKEKDMIVLDHKEFYWPTTELEQSLYLEMVHPYSYKHVYLNITVEYNSKYGGVHDKWSGKFLPERNQ